MVRIDWITKRRALVLVAGVVSWSAIFGVVFTLAEIGVRFRHRVKFGSFRGIEDTYTIDSKSGLRIPVPGGRFGAIHINSLGFRGPEIVVPKPLATVRIAFIGSSTTYCADVSSNENAWPHLVAQELQAKWPLVDVDYVNAGVPGYSVRASLRNLQSRVAGLQPDIIVIYEGFNDISGNGLDLAARQGIASKPTEQTLTWPSRYSLLWYLVEKNLLVWEHQMTALHSQGKLVIDEGSLVGPFRTDFADLVKASKRVAAVVAVATLSTRIRREQSPAEQIKAGQTSLYYMPYISIPNLLRLYEKYNEAIAEIGSDNGAIIIADEHVIPGTAEYFADSVHFSDKGSYLMAQRVSQDLLRSRFVQEIMARRSEAVSSVPGKSIHQRNRAGS